MPNLPETLWINPTTLDTTRREPPYTLDDNGHYVYNDGFIRYARYKACKWEVEHTDFGREVYTECGLSLTESELDCIKYHCYCGGEIVEPE